VALDGDYSLTPTHQTGAAEPGFGFSVTGAVNLLDCWGLSSTTWVAMNYTSGIAAEFGGFYQIQLSANTFNTTPIYTYDFTARSIGVAQITFRAKYPATTPYWRNAVRIEAYNSATLVGRSTRFTSDIGTPGGLPTIWDVSLDCASATVTRIVVYIESGYSHPSYLAAAGYGIELTKFFVEDLGGGDGGDGGDGDNDCACDWSAISPTPGGTWTRQTNSCASFTLASLPGGAWTQQTGNCADFTLAALPTTTWTKRGCP
jgi:hypothetical protein